LAEFTAENVKSLKLLRADERIKILRFSDELIKTFGKLSKEVLADAAAKDPLTRRQLHGVSRQHDGLDGTFGARLPRHASARTSLKRTI